MQRKRLEGDALDRYLAAITDALVGTFAPQRVILFGSFARGDQNRASDVDLVVVAPTPLPFCERIGRALASCYGVSSLLPVEVLVYTPEEWERMTAMGSTFARVISREGRVLYDGQQKLDRSPAVVEAGTARP